MTQPFWKRHLALAVLVAAPVLSAGGAAFALPAGGAPPAAADVQRATSLFIKATELFKAKKYVPALDHFKQSYALVPSPNSHLYIARCLSSIGEYRAAWLEFDRTGDEATAGGSKYTPTHDSALQERDELSAKIGLVTIVVPRADPGTTVRAGVFDVPADRWGKPFPVDPGRIDVTVQIPGQPPVTQTITVGRGERRDVDLGALIGPANGPIAGPGPIAPQPSRPLNPLRIGAFIAAGVGVAGFVMFGVEGAASKSTYNTLNTACSGKQGCPSPIGGRTLADQLISTGKSQQAIANAGLGIGVVGIAAGATLFVLSLRKPASSDAGLLVPHTQPRADLVVGPSWTGVRGSF